MLLLLSPPGGVTAAERIGNDVRCRVVRTVQPSCVCVFGRRVVLLVEIFLDERRAALHDDITSPA